MTRLFDLMLAPFRRAPRRPLSMRQPRIRSDDTAVPLGMEALDMNIVKAANRRNDALERVNPGLMPRRHADATQIDAMPDDATYAKTFHKAFNRTT